MAIFRHFRYLQLECSHLVGYRPNSLLANWQKGVYQAAESLWRDGLENGPIKTELGDFDEIAGFTSAS